MNIFICRFCDLIGIVARMLPSTPSQFTIGHLITSAGDTFPFIGSGIIYEIYTSVQGLFLVFALIKAAKILQYFKVW
ncbi:MAG: hypothetical protein RID09_20320 [Coleofasciculus sp. G1-WW12-02]|uniref:hypothetical protein n=1 Tax=Coleofasciculus sp. G1-WW12-02 TaxID=3068483 RepID=UPI0033002AC0